MPHISGHQPDDWNIDWWEENQAEVSDAWYDWWYENILLGSLPDWATIGGDGAHWGEGDFVQGSSMIDGVITGEQYPGMHYMEPSSNILSDPHGEGEPMDPDHASYAQWSTDYNLQEWIDFFTDYYADAEEQFPGGNAMQQFVQELAVYFNNNFEYSTPHFFTSMYQDEFSSTLDYFQDNSEWATWINFPIDPEEWNMSMLDFNGDGQLT